MASQTMQAGRLRQPPTNGPSWWMDQWGRLGNQVLLFENWRVPSDPYSHRMYDRSGNPVPNGFVRPDWWVKMLDAPINVSLVEDLANGVDSEP